MSVVSRFSRLVAFFAFMSGCTGASVDNADLKETVAELEGYAPIKVFDKCLDAYQQGTVNGTPMQIWTCNSQANQLFTDPVPVNVPMMIKISTGRCVAAKQGGTVDGTIVHLYDCDGGVAQIWTRTPAGELRGPGDKCMDVVGGTNNTGSRIQTWTCNGSAGQKFFPASTDYRRRPFAATSAWNTKIPTTATYRDEPLLRVTNTTWANSGSYGIKLYTTDSTKYNVTITYPAGYNCHPGGTVSLRAAANPDCSDITPPAGSDGTISFLDAQNNKTFDFWQVQGTGCTRTASAGVAHTLDGTGYGLPNGCNSGTKPSPAGIRAAWVSAAAGLVRGWHFGSGAVIDHAIAVSFRNDQLKPPTCGSTNAIFPVAVWQDSGACYDYTGTMAMGTRLAIPRTVDLTTLNLQSDIGRKLAKAAQDYGFYVVDRHYGDSALTVYASENEVTSTQLAALRNYPGKAEQDLNRIKNALRVVNP